MRLTLVAMEKRFSLFDVLKGSWDAFRQHDVEHNFSDFDLALLAPVNAGRSWSGAARPGVISGARV